MHSSKVLIISILIGIGSLLSSCNPKTTDEYIVSAQEYIDISKTDKAIIELKNALLQDPQRIDARILLGQSYYQMSEFANAEKEFRNAQRYGAEQDSYFLLLLKSIYYQNNFSEADILSQKYTGQDKSIANLAKLYGYLSTIRLDKVNPDLPIGLTGDALLIAKANKALLENRPTETLKLTENISVNSDERVEALIIRGIALSALGQFEEANSAYQEIVDIYPYYYFARFQLIETLIKLENLVDARKNIEFLLNINPDSGLGSYHLAKVSFKEDKYEEALLYANKAFLANINDIELNFMAGVSAYKTGRIESAYEFLSKNKNKVPPNHINNKILAEVSLKLGYAMEVIPQINELNLSNENQAIVYSSAAITQFQLGNFAQANELIKKANEADPDNSVTLLQEGLIKLSSNDLSGIDSLTESIKYDQSISESWLLLAEAHIRNGEFEEAFAVAHKWQESNEIDGLALEGYIYLKQENIEKAQGIFQQILLSEPEHSGAMRYLMLIDARKENFDSAKSYAEKLIAQSPNSLMNIMSYVNIHIATNKVNTVKSFLQNMISQNSSNQEAIIALSSIYTFEGDLDKALQFLNETADSSNDLIQKIKGDMYMKMRKYDDAYKQYDLWSINDPKQPPAWFKKINALVANENYTEALNATESALKHFPNDPRLIAAKGNFLTKAGKIKEAKNLLLSVEKFQKHLPIITAYLGELAIYEKDYLVAETLLRKYYQQEPSFGIAELLAIALQYNNKAKEGAKILINELNQLKYNDIERHIVAEYLANNEMYEESIKYYHEILEDHPLHFITINNYAAALTKAGQLSKALELAQIGLKSFPNSEFALDTYGWILFKQGKISESLIYLAKAYEKQPNNNEIALHYIESLIANNRVTEAKRLLNYVKPFRDKEIAEFKRLKQSL
ncbi:PEP-CTERM system TPR-repeat protein PrsT [Paraglaciecola aquimarina]|uniref:PEP-CTERM system TPR-repeat protein PrsT n=1 Tax=Paraglaciecola algarum TaxID=3050085 RepID=A0ABS9D6S3_9ALTE|nr:PEP-CTERM system TPR-repeat protein PrsT [Paraglaciecola sp. G1-23]